MGWRGWTPPRRLLLLLVTSLLAGAGSKDGGAAAAGATAGAKGAASAVLELDDGTFDAATASGVWLVKFASPRCPHCARLAPVFERVAKETGGSAGAGAAAPRFGSVSEVALSPQLRRRFSVVALPRLLLLRDGWLVTEYEGPPAAEGLRAFLRRAAAGFAVPTVNAQDPGAVAEIQARLRPLAPLPLALAKLAERDRVAACFVLRCGGSCDSAVRTPFEVAAVRYAHFASFFLSVSAASHPAPPPPAVAGAGAGAGDVNVTERPGNGASGSDASSSAHHTLWLLRHSGNPRSFPVASGADLMRTVERQLLPEPYAIERRGNLAAFQRLILGRERPLVTALIPAADVPSVDAAMAAGRGGGAREHPANDAAAVGSAAGGYGPLLRLERAFSDAAAAFAPHFAFAITPIDADLRVALPPRVLRPAEAGTFPIVAFTGGGRRPRVFFDDAVLNASSPEALRAGLAALRDNRVALLLPPRGALDAVGGAEAVFALARKLFDACYHFASKSLWHLTAFLSLFFAGVTAAAILPSALTRARSAAAFAGDAADYGEGEVRTPPGRSTPSLRRRREATRLRLLRSTRWRMAEATTDAGESGSLSSFSPQT